MTPDAILADIHGYLVHQLHGPRGTEERTHLKQEIFNCFTDAYQLGLLEDELSGQAIRDHFRQTWIHDDDPDPLRIRKEELLDRFVTMWEEWEFVWNRVDLDEN